MSFFGRVNQLGVLVLINGADTKAKGFAVYWNVPSEVCHRHGYNFSHLNNYGIIQNNDDKFKGNQITILYSPGMFPAIINGKDRNGGVPQEGDISLHLEKFQKDLVASIPDQDFKGVGVIDFEDWRPIFRENWSKLDIYRQRSREIEQRKDPSASKATLEKRASQRFEKAATTYMTETLLIARKLRPKAKWGYYAFPYCFNYTPNNPHMYCSKEVKQDNDRSKWMYKTGNALFPSIYIYGTKIAESKRAKQIEGRVEEAMRVAALGNSPLAVLPYASYNYQDTGHFLTKSDMKSSVIIPKKMGADGIVIWGASKDVSSPKKCAQLSDYVDKVLGPLIKKASDEMLRDE